MKHKTYNSRSEKETQKIAKDFAGRLVPGDVVCLYGDLGFGKTTFTKGIAAGLGIQDRIISPTFTIIRKHGVLQHVDLYRIESREQLTALGFEEILEDQDAITVVEWPEQAYDLLPKKRWDIRLELTLIEKDREIIITQHE